MKHRLIKGLAVGLAGIATLFTTQSTISAASQYSAKRSREVKLIWRKAMGRHAFTAPTGARFSKHLGTRYGYNTETANVTWYTDAHEKLYLKNLNMYSIYYHVTNSDQSLQGWIWKGYLKPATNDNPGSTNTGSKSGNNASSNTSRKNDPVYNFYNTPVNSALIDNVLNQKVEQIFPGTIPNDQIQQIADKYSKGTPDLNTDSLNHAVGDPYSGYASSAITDLNDKYFTHITIFEIQNDQRTRSLIAQLQAGTINIQTYLNKVIPLVVQNDTTSQKTVNSYTGMNIGAYMFPKGNSRYGEGVAILVPNL